MYAEDLAYIQHAGYGDFARSAAPGLLRLLGDAAIDRGLVVDLGCGAGVWLRELTRAGYDAFGIDASAALVRFAREAAPEARVRRGSAFASALPRCEAITAIGEVLSYCPSGRPAPSYERLFRRVARSLRPGGLFLFDLMVEGAPMAYRTFSEGSDWAVLSEVSEQRQRRRLVREITTFRRVGSGYRRGHERHEQRVASRRRIEASLRAAGFTVRASRRYGSFELAPRRLAFLARRVRGRGDARMLGP